MVDASVTITASVGASASRGGARSTAAGVGRSTAGARRPAAPTIRWIRRRTDPAIRRCRPTPPAAAAGSTGRRRRRPRRRARSRRGERAKQRDAPRLIRGVAHSELRSCRRQSCDVRYSRLIDNGTIKDAVAQRRMCFRRDRSAGARVRVGPRISGWRGRPRAAAVFLLAPADRGPDLRVPFVYRRDALLYSSVIKSTVDHGWFWRNPSLGAPAGLLLYDYPNVAHEALHLLAIKALVGLHRRLGVAAECLFYPGVSAYRDRGGRGAPPLGVSRGRGGRRRVALRVPADAAAQERGPHLPGDFFPGARWRS